MNRNKELILLRQLNKNLITYYDLPLELQHDQKIILKCLKYDSTIAKLFPENLKANKTFLIEALNVNPMIFGYMNADLKRDEQLINIMLNSFTHYNEYRDWCNNTELDIYKDSILSYFPHAKNNKKIVYKIFKSITWKSGQYEKMFKNIYDNLNENLKNDINFLALLIKIQPILYKNLPPRLQEDPAFMTLLMKATSGNIFPYFHEDLRSDPFFVHHMSKLAIVDKCHLGIELKEDIGKSDIKTYTESFLLKESIENKLQSLNIQNNTVKKKVKI